MYRRDRRLHTQITRAPLPDTVRYKHDLYVDQTYAIAGPPGTGVHHYTIAFVTEDGDPSITVVTRNVAIYQIAVQAEGDPNRRFDVVYHPSQQPDGTYCQLLDALEAQR